MYLVSKLKKFLLFFTMSLIVFGAALLTDVSAAEAAVVKTSTTSHVTPFPAGVFAIKGSVSIRAQANVSHQSTFKTVDVWGWVEEAACDSNPLVGFTLGMTSDTCDDSIVGTVGDTAADVADCGLNIPLCINNYLYGIVGSGVSWVATGIISLVTSTREECLPGDDSGSGDWERLNRACDLRIHEDYFPITYERDRKLSDVVWSNYADQRRELRADLRLMRGTPVAERGADFNEVYRVKVAQLKLLTGSTDDGSLKENLSASELRNQNSTFDVPKSAVSTGTWDREYGKYILIALLIMVPMIIAAAMQSVISGKGHLMLRAIAIHMPIAILGMIVAPWLVRRLMGITDAFSAFIISDVQSDIGGFFENMNPQTQSAMGTPLLLGFMIIALVFIFAGLMVWFVLTMREASVALIAAFLPVALAASIWPALGKWAIRAIKLLVAAIISKIFIVGALSLGLGTFGGATQGGTVSFSHMIFGSTVFFIAAFSPHLVMKFFDEIGDAMNAAGGTGALARGMGAAANANGARQLMGMGGGGGSVGGGSGGHLGRTPGSSNGLAQLGAELKNGSPAEAAAAADRIAQADGQSGGGRIHSAAQGAGAGIGASEGDKVNGAADSALAQVAPGVAPGSANATQAEAAGKAVAESAVQHGASPQEAASLGSAAAGRAMGGVPTASMDTNIASHAGGAAVAHRANTDPAQNMKISKAKVVAGALLLGPVGIAMAAAGHTNKKANVRKESGWT